MAKHIIDFNKGENMSLEVIIKRSDFRLAKNGKNFLSLVFEDKSGQIPGKYWDASQEDAQKFHVGAVVQLEGRRDLYQGKPQVNITRLGVLDEKTVDMSQFVQTAPMKRKDMEDEFDDVFLQITNGAWNRIVRYLFKKYHDQFFTSAAAKSNHHDFQGGLAYHTLSMVRIAEKMADLYPQINRALLIAGACLHDFGKIIELSGSLDIEYTFEGNMLGHITIVDEEIEEPTTPTTPTATKKSNGKKRTFGQMNTPNAFDLLTQSAAKKIALASGSGDLPTPLLTDEDFLAQAGALLASANSNANADKPYKCPVGGCDKAYKNPNGLKYHNQHGHCNMTADDSDNMAKPYQCTIGDCGKRYKNLNGLKYHIEHSHMAALNHTLATFGSTLFSNAFSNEESSQSSHSSSSSTF